MTQLYDVVIVGAGPAGVGIAARLRQLGVEKLLVVDRYQAGASFLRWPQETRLITPSFYANPFGPVDLNAVTPESSPALTSGSEHLSGAEYADYLQQTIASHQIPLQAPLFIEQVSLLSSGEYRLQGTHGETLICRVLIWATGEFQFPDRYPFPGAELCCHYADVASWRDFQVDNYLVIGGYESAVDAAVNLLDAGSRVQMLCRRSPWGNNHLTDPSVTLSPRTRERLRSVTGDPPLEIFAPADIVEVTAHKGSEGGWLVHAADGRIWHSRQRPLLATGFRCGGGARQISPFFDWTPQGFPRLTAEDGSTRFDGLFLVGPQVRQGENIYCFIYKFRQRFAAVAHGVARILNLPLPQSEAWPQPAAEACCPPGDNGGCAC